MARDQGRVLLTEDKDFGWYVYAKGEGGIGVLLIRFPASSRRLLGSAVLGAESRTASSQESGGLKTCVLPRTC